MSSHVAVPVPSQVACTFANSPLSRRPGLPRDRCVSVLVTARPIAQKEATARKANRRPGRQYAVKGQRSACILDASGNPDRKPPVPVLRRQVLPRPVRPQPEPQVRLRLAR
jgi:hypothetical protein